jgi:hypothetical protein
MHHLKKVRDKGGDASHPIDDPLWQSPDVKYYLQPRPPKYDAPKRKAAQQYSHHRYYVKRTKLQEEQADAMMEKYLAGEIDAEQYKTFLIGKRRNQFLEQERIRSIEQRIREEKEAELQTRIEERLAELRSQQQLDGTTSTAAAIKGLENARDQLQSSDDMVAAYKRQISMHSRAIVTFFATESFLSSEQTLLEYRRFTWPTDPSVESFYTFAAVLTPEVEWDEQIRSDQHLRHMQATLTRYINAEKNNVEEDEIPQLDQILGTFNSCCDIIEESENRSAQMTMEGAQRWLDDQSELWERIRQEVKKRLNLHSRPLIELVRMVDEFTDLERGLKDVEQQAELARKVAEREAQVGCALF